MSKVLNLTEVTSTSGTPSYAAAHTIANTAIGMKMTQQQQQQHRTHLLQVQKPLLSPSAAMALKRRRPGKQTAGRQQR